MKNVVWLGGSRASVTRFPKAVRREIGLALYAIQQGFQPADYKPMKTIGAGVNEIRVKVFNQYRVIYVAKFEEAVYVLHGFMKKTQKTTKQDLAMAKYYYQEVIAGRKKR